MSSEFGINVRVSVFGESHGPYVGVVLSGISAGFRIDNEALTSFMERRAPGRRPTDTTRFEEDIPVFESGVADGITTGDPIRIVLPNRGQRSSDYDGLIDKPRPSHADYPAWVRSGGKQDMRGGGPFSGRLTAPLCATGAIAAQILAEKDIYTGAHLLNVGGITDYPFPLHPTKELFESVAKKTYPVISDPAGDRMRLRIEDVKNAGDSVGGIIECAIIGLPAGLGGPMFDGVENLLARAVFGIPGIKGIEFGKGFDSASMRGSQHNDPFFMDGDAVRTSSNNAGGILGGLTSGMPIVFRAAVKPTSSIGLPQNTVDLKDGTDTVIQIKGRHDPCIAVRAVPVIEAVASLVALDIISGVS